jgi:type I restriction enzyme S subunit
MSDGWRTAAVLDLQREGVLLVEDGNHGEYRPRTDEFVSRGVAFIRAADMDGGRVLFDRASRIVSVHCPDWLIRETIPEYVRSLA